MEDDSSYYANITCDYDYVPPAFEYIDSELKKKYKQKKWVCNQISRRFWTSHDGATRDTFFLIAAGNVL